MEHLIRFKTAEGIDGTHTAATLDDAVAFAERVRNAEGATALRLYRLTEVPIEFRPYYRIEVGPVDGSEYHQLAPPDHPAAEHHPDYAVPVTGHDGARSGEELHGGDHDPAGTNGRRLFSRTQ